MIIRKRKLDISDNILNIATSLGGAGDLVLFQKTRPVSISLLRSTVVPGVEVGASKLPQALFKLHSQHRYFLYQGSRQIPLLQRSTYR